MDTAARAAMGIRGNVDHQGPEDRVELPVLMAHPEKMGTLVSVDSLDLRDHQAPAVEDVSRSQELPDLKDPVGHGGPKDLVGPEDHQAQLGRQEGVQHKWDALWHPHNSRFNLAMPTAPIMLLVEVALVALSVVASDALLTAPIVQTAQAVRVKTAATGDHIIGVKGHRPVLKPIQPPQPADGQLEILAKFWWSPFLSSPKTTIWPGQKLSRMRISFSGPSGRWTSGLWLSPSPLVGFSFVCLKGGGLCATVLKTNYSSQDPAALQMYHQLKHQPSSDSWLSTNQ